MMTTRKFLLYVAVAIWVLGAVYMAPRALEELRADIVDDVEGRNIQDPLAPWKSMWGIMFPSLLVQADQEEALKAD